MQDGNNQTYDMPDERGHFGQFGGIFVAETLVEALEELRVINWAGTTNKMF